MTKPFNRFFYFLAITGLVLVNFIAQPVFAVAPQSLKDVLSDSRPSVDVDHTVTVQLSASNTWASSETLVIDFADSFDTTGFANTEPEDFDIKWASTDKTIVADTTCAADQIEIDSVNTTTDVFTFSLCAGSTASAAGETIEIQIGNNATFATGSGNDQIGNPTAAVYTITVTPAGDDAKDTLVAVIAGVDLSATVDETLTFTVALRTTSDCNTLVTGGTETNDSTATTLPFGTLNSDTFYNECQRLTVGTNAALGYSTTVNTTTRPTSGGNTIAKATCDGAACSDTVSAPWDTATNNGYGYCVKDSTGDGAATADGTEWTAAQQCGGGSQAFKSIARTDASDTPRSIMASAVATAANDVTDIGVRISIGAGQAAGTYTTVVIYITTPTF